MQLPRPEIDAVSRSKGRFSNEKSAESGRPKILLVDDNPAILKRVETLLRTRFEIVGVSPNGAEALELVEASSPDVVVLDISMPPGLSGIELARMIRRRNAKPRFVYLTQHEDSGLAEATREEGGYAYVVKRCLATDLIPAIETVIRGGSFVSRLAP